MDVLDLLPHHVVALDLQRVAPLLSDLVGTFGLVVELRRTAPAPPSVTEFESRRRTDLLCRWHSRRVGQACFEAQAPPCVTLSPNGGPAPKAAGPTLRQ